MKNIILFLSFLSVIVSYSQVPSWVERKPTSKFYFIGIGFGDKKNDDNYRRTAKDRALSEIASEIKIKIKSDFKSHLSEISDKIFENTQINISSFSNVELEGYQLEDVFENNSEYWVYYKLSKSLYEQLKWEKIQSAIEKSKELVLAGENAIHSNDISTGISLLINSLVPISKFINESLNTKIRGKNIDLLNYIYQSLQNILSNIRLKIENNNIIIKIKDLRKKPIYLETLYNANDKLDDLKSKNIPVNISFLKGNGKFINNYVSDNNANVKIQINNLDLAFPSYQLMAIFDINYYLTKYKNDKYNLIKTILGTLVLPKSYININLVNSHVFVKSIEKNLNVVLKDPIITPNIINYLSYRHFDIVESSNKADYVLKVFVDTKKGSELYGMYSSFISITLSVFRADSRNEIFSIQKSNIKGLGNNYSNAGINAYKNTIKELKKNILKNVENSFFN